MTNKTLFFLSVFALLLGGALGGVLIVVLDEGASDPTPASTLAVPAASASGAPDLERLGELAQGIESGELDAEALQELREIAAQFQGGLGTGLFPGTGFGGQMIGVVESFEGDLLTVNTPIGPLQATVGDETAIVAISESEGELDDLVAGLQVTVQGERDENGVLVATEISVIPEGVDLPFGGQPAAGATRRGQGQGQATMESPEEGVVIIADAATSPSGGGEALPTPPADLMPGGSGGFSFEGPSQRGGAAGRGLTGVVESLQDGVLTLTTPRGPLQAAIGEGTIITIFVETSAKPDDLTPGAAVMLSGTPDDAGPLQATTITILPEGTAAPFGATGRFGGGRP